MTIATLLSRQRRVLVLCGATVLLHYVAIGWAGAGLGAPAPRVEPLPSPVIVAALHTPPEPERAALAAARPPAKPARASPKPRGRPAAAPQQVLVEVPGAGPTLEAMPPSPPEAAPQPGTAALEAPISGAPAEAEPAKAEPAVAPQYKVSLPPSAQLILDVSSINAKGSVWAGKALMDWSRSGAQYRMSLNVKVFVLTVANLVSEGVLNDAGIAPRRMTEKRLNKSQTATHFDADQGSITFSASEASVPLTPGAQDRATFAMQLAGIARADPAQLDSDITLLVGEVRRAELYRFTVAGQEELNTPMGTINTWKLSRAPKPGSYNSRIDVWLAPAYDWYPVQVRNTESNGAVTTQTIRKIVVNESGQ